MLNKKYFIMDTIDKNETEDLLEKGVEFMDTLENPSMDDKAKKNKEKMISSLFVFACLTIMGNGFLLMSPLWVGIVFIIPGFSLFLRFWIKMIEQGNVTFDANSHGMLHKSSSHRDQKTYFQKNSYGNSSSRYGVNCTSLTDRRNKFGY